MTARPPLPVFRLPAGFSASAAACGIRKHGRDLALFASDRDATAAALFTRNLFPAAPVVESARRLALSRGRARAILVNAGCANAATGKAGEAACRRTLAALERVSGCAPDRLLVASTGVIGEPLPAGKIVSSVPALWRGLAPRGFEQAASAILTTDTRPKTAHAEFSWRGQRARVTGCAKGAGMIHPRLVPSAAIARAARGNLHAHETRPHATMLAFLFTDAAVSGALLRRALAEAAGGSLNTISVDGDTSTNDSVFLLANGASGLTVARGGSSDRPRPGDRPHPGDRPPGGPWARFLEALSSVTGSLAEQIVHDGEGARRVLRIEVTGARDHRAADRVAREIARSPLVKTALAGGDANWGRILSAAGASGARFDPRHAELALAGIPVARGGAAIPFDRARLDAAFDAPEVRVRLRLGRGPGRAGFLTCDLTEAYVRINADYRS